MSNTKIPQNKSIHSPFVKTYTNALTSDDVLGQLVWLKSISIYICLWWSLGFSSWFRFVAWKHVVYWTQIWYLFELGLDTILGTRFPYLVKLLHHIYLFPVLRYQLEFHIKLFPSNFHQFLSNLYNVQIKIPHVM